MDAMEEKWKRLGLLNQLAIVIIVGCTFGVLLSILLNTVAPR